MTFDIFNPQVSVVAKGLEGKVITIYGSNSLGKTKQATRMKKPFYIPFEAGLNAIAGVPFLAVNNWSDFKKLNKQLTSSKTLDKVKELYQTIIFDEVEAAAKYCQRYICEKYESESISEGKGGFGLWKEYENEAWSEINKLIGAGFTVIFIAHEEETKDGKIKPKGDKRTLAPIIDNSDIVVHLTSNGVDEKGKVIKSSAWLAENSEAFARSRFDYIDTYIEEFTAEALEEVIIKAIERQEKIEGIKTVTYNEQKATQTSEELDYEKLMQDILQTGKEIAEHGKRETVTEIVENNLGVGKKVTECSKSQVQVMAVILSELKEALKEIEDSE